MAKPTKQKAAKEYTCQKSGRTISVGEPYWKLKFRFGPAQIRALEYPFARSETTQSEYLSTIYSLIDNFSLSDISLPSEAESVIDALVEELQGICDEQQDKLYNMPESLQESSILNERVESIESTISEIENNSYDYDDADQTEVMEELELENTWENLTEFQREQVLEKMDEINQEKIEEIESLVVDALSGLDI